MANISESIFPFTISERDEMMIEILGRSFSMLEIVLLILLLLFILAQASWWIGHRYFIRRLCISVHKNLGRWFESELKMLSAFEAPSVFGFLCSLILLGIITLNVTLLAQVFELFVPPGRPVRIQYIGTYGSFPLSVGLLFALVQVAFSTLRKMKKLRDESTRVITVAIAMSIVIEAGLNVYRAWLVTSGQQPISPTLWDQWIMYGGSILAGFLGILVPLAEILLSPYAMLEFLQPLIKDTVIGIRFLSSSILLGLAFIYFGFHDKTPTILPGSVSRLRSGIKKLRENVFSLNSTVDYLEDLSRGLNDTPTESSQLDKQISDLNSKINELKLDGANERANTAQREIAELDRFISQIGDKKKLREAIKRVKGLSRSVNAGVELRKGEIADLAETIHKTPAKHKVWKKTYETFAKELMNAKRQSETLRELAGPDSQLNSLYQAINSALKKDANLGQVLTNVEVEILRNLDSPPRQFDKYERRWARTVSDASKEEVQSASSEFVESKHIMENCLRTLSSLEARFHVSSMMPTEADFQRMSKELVYMDNNITKTEKAIIDQLKIWRSEMRSKAIQVRSISIFVALIFPWQQKI